MNEKVARGTAICLAGAVTLLVLASAALSARAYVEASGATVDGIEGPLRLVESWLLLVGPALFFLGLRRNAMSLMWLGFVAYGAQTLWVGLGVVGPPLEVAAVMFWFATIFGTVAAQLRTAPVPAA